MISFATGEVTDDGDAETGGEELGVGDSAGVAAGAEALASGDAVWWLTTAAQLVETKNSPMTTAKGIDPAHTLS